MAKFNRATYHYDLKVADKLAHACRQFDNLNPKPAKNWPPLIVLVFRSVVNWPKNWLKTGQKLAAGFAPKTWRDQKPAQKVAYARRQFYKCCKNWLNNRPPVPRQISEDGENRPKNWPKTGLLTGRWFLATYLRDFKLAQ